ncbi:MAG: trypsin-like peptidase domain-containing protein [Planctomycetota bacterium]
MGFLAWPVARGDSLPELIKIAESERIAGIQHAMPSTVCVFVPGGAGGGSGVLISPDGFALTNFHVSSPAGTYMRCGLSDGNIYDAVVVGIDPVGDLAMIRLLGRDDFPVATFVDSRLVRVGDWCFAIGNPFLLATNLQPTVSFGIISGKNRYQYPSGTLLEYADCFQTDASINPGNSGGPLYSADGNLIGVIGRASFEKRGRVNVGVGYAISGNQAQNFIGVLRSGRIVDHATLGATVGTDPDAGVATVTNILESSDAYRRGLRYGDEILEIDGRIVQTANDVQNVLATFPARWRIPLTYRHQGEVRKVLVRLRSVHRQDELLTKMKAALPPPPPRPTVPEPDGEPDDDRSEPELGRDLKGDPNSNESDEEPAKESMLDASGQPIPGPASRLIELRSGFGNYYFNRLRQDRFIRELRGESQTPWRPDASSTWVVRGQATMPGEEETVPIEIRVGSDEWQLVTAGQTYRPNNADDLVLSVDERSFGGLLSCLNAYRRMLIVGPSEFGDTFFWGSAPLGGERPLRDVTIGVDAGLENWFWQHPETGRLEVIESFGDRDGDPAECWLTKIGNTGPEQIQLRYGLDTVLSIDVESWTCQRVPAEAEL